MQITQTKWNNILKGAKAIVHDEAPYKEGRPLKHPSRSTGNLKENALKLEQVATNEWKIFIDERVAYYMPYTEEPWISPKWRGAKNPNEKWFENATKMVYEYISRRLTIEASKQVARWKPIHNVAGYEDEEEE